MPRETSVADFVGAVDQGTTSTRFMIFDHDGNEVARHQLEHQQILPRAGWVEHDPVEIWERTRTVHRGRAERGRPVGGRPGRDRDRQPAGDHRRVEPPHRPSRTANAIVWQDTRTDRIAAALDKGGAGEVIRRKAGLPPATYFSGGKLRWLLAAVARLRADAERGQAIFGTIDTWLLWNLTGGVARRRARHRRDERQPDDADGPARRWTGTTSCARCFGVPRAMLPRIVPSVHAFGVTSARRGRGAARCRSAGCSATSRRPRWARCASRPARRRTPTAPATSWC